jgi:hypothetical protein
MKKFTDDRIGAVAGNVKSVNKDHPLAKIEYITCRILTGGHLNY